MCEPQMRHFSAIVRMFKRIKRNAFTRFVAEFSICGARTWVDWPTVRTHKKLGNSQVGRLAGGTSRKTRPFVCNGGDFISLEMAIARLDSSSEI